MYFSGTIVTLDHEKEALANISTTKPQEIVRGLRMEAVKETKITLIHRLNVTRQ
jgi:hypothetical protein